jgi:hypothetical protein
VRQNHGDKDQDSAEVAPGKARPRRQSAQPEDEAAGDEEEEGGLGPAELGQGEE